MEGVDELNELWLYRMTPEMGVKGDERLMGGRPQQFVSQCCEEGFEPKLGNAPPFLSYSSVINTDISACQEPR
jgi:hypothetical protein